MDVLQKKISSLLNNVNIHNSHPFRKLTAFIDADGIIRVGGRSANANISIQGKHPVILANNSHLSHLIIDQAHLCTLHRGKQLTLTNVRQQYWMIGGRNSVKSKCARQRGIRAHQLMGQLSLSRVALSPASSHVGIDYAGPITSKSWKGRGSKTLKGWICVFVCFSTSAVHLRIATDYSAEGFIAIYRRFSSRRSISSAIYTDWRTNFMGADAQLPKMFIQASKEHHDLNFSFVKECTGWKFSPPAAPRMGGEWEEVVKSTKFHLQRTIADTFLTYEEYVTLLTRIDALLNSRPLQPASDDPEDLNYLTPSHLIIGKSITALPDPTVDMSISSRNNWHLIQQRVTQFWKHWSSQYLQRL